MTKWCIFHLAFSLMVASLPSMMLSAQPRAFGAAEAPSPSPMPSESNPLAPVEKRSRIGLEAGLIYVMQSGSFDAGCGVFEQGAKLNVGVAAAYDLLVGDRLRIEGLVGFQTKSLHQSYDRVETLMLTIPGIDPIGAPVEFENVGEARFSYVYLQPSAKYYLTTGLYAGAGINAGVRTSASTRYTKNIVTRSAVIDPIGPVEFYYAEDESSDRYSKVFPSEVRDDASGLALDGVFYAGVEIRTGGKLVIGPRVQYSLPITAVIDKPELRLSGLQLSIGARYRID